MFTVVYLKKHGYTNKKQNDTKRGLQRKLWFIYGKSLQFLNSRLRISVKQIKNHSCINNIANIANYIDSDKKGVLYIII